MPSLKHSNWTVNKASQQNKAVDQDLPTGCGFANHG